MDAPRYHPVSIALHWLIVLFVLAQLVLGWWMIDIPKSPPGPRAWWFNLHKSIGLTIGVLMLARLGWRLSHAAPPLPDSMPRWQRNAAREPFPALCLPDPAAALGLPGLDVHEVSDQVFRRDAAALGLGLSRA